MATEKAKTTEKKTAAADEVAEGVKVQIISKEKIKIGSMWAGNGAIAYPAKELAEKLVKAGDAVKVYD